MKQRNRRIKKKIKPILFQVWFFLFALLTFSINWAKDTYGNLKFDEILFHLNTPLGGVGGGLVGSYIKKALVSAIIVWLIEFILVQFPLKNKMKLRFRILREKFEIGLLPFRIPAFCWGVIFIIWGGALLSVSDKSFSMIEYMADQLRASSFIEKNYVSADSVQITFPEKKRNLVMIYLESMETSLQDKANGGIMNDNYIPELTAIAKDNVSFSQNEQIVGAHVTPGSTWTIAGLVSETAGVPLKKAGTHVTDANQAVTKEMTLSGATALGDILQDAGYKNVFMAGSRFTFAGRDLYFKEHGDYEVLDYNWAKETGRIAPDYEVWWGFEDAKLLEYAKEELTELAASGEPFNLSLLTVDTHFPSGYVCDRCENLYSIQYANVYACSSRLVNELIEWIKQQNFYENTTIAITGDHLSMDSAFFSDRTDRSNSSDIRQTYEAFVNPAVEPLKEKDRKFTTLDMYPTILGSLGVNIEGDRLGLGTNLFSNTQTLSEEYGYDYIDEELSQKSNFYDKKLMAEK